MLQTSISHYRREAEQSGTALRKAELDLVEKDLKMEELQRLLTGMEKVTIVVIAIWPLLTRNRSYLPASRFCKGKRRLVLPVAMRHPSVAPNLSLSLALDMT